MDWDDEYDNGYSDMGNASHRDNFVFDKGSSEARFDPMDITNPVSAYFFLSDDTQDEISGSDKKKMKCLSCGRRFIGEFYDSCPKCFSSDTEEVVSTIDGDEEISVRANMKCLDCGHTFVGEIYDRCPECFSSDIEEVADEKDHSYW